MSEQQHQHRQQQQQQPQRPHRHHHGSSLTAKYIKGDFLCRLNFNNKLPPIPCESKLLNLPFNPSEYDKYQLTTLELKRKYEPVIPKRTAIFARDFIDPSTYTPTADTTTTTTPSSSSSSSSTQQPSSKRAKFLDIEDFELLEDTNPYKLDFDAYLAAKDAEEEKARREAAAAEEEAKRETKRRQQKSSSSSDAKRSVSPSHASTANIKPDTLENQRTIIEQSFEDAKNVNNFKHPENSNAVVVDSIPVFPSFELYGVENVYVRSQANPLFDRETTAEENASAVSREGPAARSIIRGVTGLKKAGARRNLAQLLYPDAKATKEADEAGKLAVATGEGGEEVYTYSGFFESEFVTEKRCFGLVISKNEHKNDSVPDANSVAEYLRLDNVLILRRTSGVDGGDESKLFVKIGKREMNAKEESEFERKQEVLLKPDRGNPYEMEMPYRWKEEEEEEEDEMEDVEKNVGDEEGDGDVDNTVFGDEDDDEDEFGNVNGVIPSSSSSDSE